MSQGNIPITVTGNIVADVELRYTQSGAAVANFRIASTPRKYDSQSGQWVDGEATFLTCNVWKQAAENVANSLTKGQRVIVNGVLRQRSFETQQGEKRSVYEIEVDEVGPSLKFATANVTRSHGNQGGNYGSQPQQPNTGHQGGWNNTQQGNQAPQQGNPGAGSGDPWNSGMPGHQSEGNFGAEGDRPPF